MRAVLFDLGNTLVSYYAATGFAPVLRKCMHGCIRVLGSEAHVDAEEVFQRALVLNVERPDHAVRPLIERLRTLFGNTLDGAEERLTRAFLAPIFATAVIDPNALPTLAALRERGLRTAIVSNTPWGSPAAPWRAELARHNLLTAVDEVVFCADVGYRKPHRAPFERALTLLGASAEDAVFVGDDARWDIAGAEEAGIPAILLAPNRTEMAPDSVPLVRNLREVLDRIASGGIGPARPNR